MGSAGVSEQLREGPTTDEHETTRINAVRLWLPTEDMRRGFAPSLFQRPTKRVGRNQGRRAQGSSSEQSENRAVQPRAFPADFPDGASAEPKSLRRIDRRSGRERADGIRLRGGSDLRADRLAGKMAEGRVIFREGGRAGTPDPTAGVAGSAGYAMIPAPSARAGARRATAVWRGSRIGL